MKSYLYEVRYGLVVAFAMLVWLTMEYALGLHTTRIEYHPSITNFYAVIPIFIMWRAVNHRRDVLEGGSIHWWQGIMSGMVISVVAGACGAPTIWFFTKYINPGFFQAMIDFAVKSGVKEEMAVANFDRTVYMMHATLMPIVYGVPTTAVLTWLSRKKNKNQTPPSAEVS
jgi:Protein of unknown function (DUF4199)